MILLKKSALRQVGIAALIALVLGVVLVGVTLAAGSDSILTGPDAAGREGLSGCEQQRSERP